MSSDERVLIPSLTTRIGDHDRRHPWRAPGLLLPLAVVLLLVVAVAAPEWFTALAPDAVDTDAILLPPGPGHWFGTDQLGRDVFCRVIYGTSQSLSIGISATLIACLGGISLGTAAGLAPPLPQRLIYGIVLLLLVRFRPQGLLGTI